MHGTIHLERQELHSFCDSNHSRYFSFLSMVRHRSSYIIFVLKINIVFVFISINDGQSISVFVFVTVTEILLPLCSVHLTQADSPFAEGVIGVTTTRCQWHLRNWSMIRHRIGEIASI